MSTNEVVIEFALESALTAAAPDGGSWLLGKAMFYQTRPSSDKFSDAIKAALTAAAPDGGSWLLGKDVFYEKLSAGVTDEVHLWLGRKLFSQAPRILRRRRSYLSSLQEQGREWFSPTPSRDSAHS